MKILITGGTGLIGLAFINRFSEHEFTVLTRTALTAKQLLPSSVKLIDSLDNLQNLDAFDAVINLVGEPIINKRWTDKQKEIICQSRWVITQQLVDLFANSQKPPQVFLSGSAIGVYGNRGDTALNESSSVTANDFPTSLCLRWEEIAKKAEPHTRVILLRTGIVLAANGGALAKMILPFKLFLGGRLSHGNQYMSWIHYQDHINAMHYLLAEDAISGAVNLVAPEAEKNIGFTQKLAKALKRKAIFPMPKVVLQLILGESSCLLLDSQKIAPQKLLEAGYRFSYPSLSLAFENLLAANAEKRN
jgi:uncharacterized protein (TIGR01777 family)